MALSSQIALADPTAIESYLRDIKKKFLPNNSWLGDNNRYSKDTINRIKIDSGTNHIRSKQLAEYISASVVLHLFDGWSHFSRGVESLIYGDIGSAIHMIYYAELRATMSLLGREGIGVFNNKHFIVDSGRKISRIAVQTGTHKFAPEAILVWAKGAKNSQTLFNSIRVRGNSFSDWFAAAGKMSGSPPSVKLAEEWLNEWSLDLKYISGDHILRNEMSYRPHELSFDYNQRIYPEVIIKVIEVWRACEPSGSDKSSDRFAVLDIHLLRIALERLYRSMGKKLKGGQMSDEFIKKIFGDLGISTSDSIFQFLRREREPDDLKIFEYAGHATMKKTIHVSNPEPDYDRIRKFYTIDDALAIMARALLLLRLGTALTSTLLEKATVSKNDLQFWLNNIGENFGMWDNVTPPDNFTDLWESVSESIGSIESELAKGSFPSLATTDGNPITSDFARIKQFQRACLWGLGI